MRFALKTNQRLYIYLCECNWALNFFAKRNLNEIENLSDKNEMKMQNNYFNKISMNKRSKTQCSGQK